MQGAAAKGAIGIGDVADTGQHLGAVAIGIFGDGIAEAVAVPALGLALVAQAQSGLVVGQGDDLTAVHRRAAIGSGTRGKGGLQGRLLGRIGPEARTRQLLVEQQQGGPAVFLVADLAFLEQRVSLVVQVQLGHRQDEKAAQGQGYHQFDDGQAALRSHNAPLRV